MGNDFSYRIFSRQYVRVVTMCVHISPICNLNCKYCFKQSDSELTFDDIQRYIDCVLQIYPRADRYIVDMSGSGEPLLRKELILKIARYCRMLSDKYLREFLPVLVTNGTLLTEKIVEELQAEGVLFGVSIDGTRNVHNKNRIFPNGDGSYDIVIKNIKSIKHKQFVGAALTYSSAELLQSFLNAYNLLPTVSMKPVRYTADKPINPEAICKAYNELVDYVLKKTLESDIGYLYALINGDDYFGKFLKRVALKRTVHGRCEAGIGRFALAGDKQIYCCPPAVHIKDGIVGDLDCGINQSRIQFMWGSLYNSHCDKCDAVSVCGGECKVVSYNRYGNFSGIDPIMCQIKLHLYHLANRFVNTLANESTRMFKWLEDICQKIEAYHTLDERLATAVKLSQGKYTFSEMKKIKDTNRNRFEELYLQLLKSAN